VDARNESKDTPLHLAAESGELKVCELLADQGADVNTPDAAGDTPLHKAASGGNPRVVRLLLDRGAKPDARNAAGKTPLDLAEEARVKEALQSPSTTRSSTSESAARV
jgi:ankyrin repeat protein